MAVTTRSLFLSVSALIRVGWASWLPPPGCVAFNESTWVFTEIPNNMVSDCRTCWHSNSGARMAIKHANRNVEFQIDMGEIIPQTVNSLVFRAQVWSQSRIGGWTVSTSEDGVNWVQQFSKGGSSSDNQWYPWTMAPDRSVGVRYIKHSITNGRYAASSVGWGMRGFNVHNCGPAGWPTTATTTTTPGDTTTVSTSTVSTSTATTSTATTSTVTTTTVTSTTTSTTETSSTTTSTTSTSTTTVTRPYKVASLVSLVDWVEPFEDSLVQEIVNDVQDRTQIDARFPQTSMASFNLVAGQETTVMVGGAEVTFPTTVLYPYGLAVATGTVSVFDDDWLDELTTTPLQGVDERWIVDPGLHGGVHIRLYNSTGGLLDVNDTGGLPIVITMPANMTTNLICAFLEKDLNKWSDFGVNTTNTSDGLLVCETNHLSFFGGIVRGFLQALSCTQFGLLTWDGIKELGSPGWADQFTAMAFWGFLVTIAIMMAIACYLDRMDPWQDEYFLIAVPSTEKPDETEGAAERKAEEEEAAAAAPEEAEEEKIGFLGRCIGVVTAPCRWCYESDVSRDVVDDICGRWFTCFSEIRGLCESVISGIECGRDQAEGGKSCWHRLSMSFSSSFVASSSRRQACATTALSDDVVSFLLEDEDLLDLLKKAEEYAAQDVEVPQNTEIVAFCKKMEKWQELHAQIITEVDDHWLSHGFCSWPTAMIRLFFISNPVVVLFLGNHFISRALRVLQFCIQLTTACMTAAIFFDASGMAKNKKNSGCGSDPTTIAESIGRIIAIALASWLIAYFPISFIDSFHDRSIKIFEKDDCPEMQRQLKSWHLQDLIVWLLSFIWGGFNIFFVAIFLANVLPAEQPNWGLSNVMSLAQDAVVVPLAIALIFPLIGTVFLCLASAVHRISHKEVLVAMRATKNMTGSWSKDLSKSFERKKSQSQGPDKDPQVQSLSF